jgi:hypothetical protein
MMKSSRSNRLKSSWICPHCRAEIGANQFRLSAAYPGSVICPTEGCGKPFPWKAQNRGKLWPEQGAYQVLR